MIGRRSSRARGVAAIVAAVVVAGVVTSVDAPGVEAKEHKAAKGAVACPGKVGSVKFDDALPFPEYNSHLCRYRLTGKNRTGSVSLSVSWSPDQPDERSRCASRTPQPQPVRPDEEHWWGLSSGTRMVVADVLWTEGAVSVKQATKALRQLIAAAEPLGHPCVPAVEPTSDEGVACPLVLPGDLVRGDWNMLQDTPVIEDWLFDGEYVLRCRYHPAYRDEPEAGQVRVSWAEDDPSNPGTALCIAGEDRGGAFERWRTGHYPVEIEIQGSFVRNWPSQARALTDGLAAAAAARASRCPDAPDGPAPFEQPSAGGGRAGSGGTTTIILSGGPGDEPPVVGATIDLAEDDQYELVVGGLGGEVIREGFIGTGGVIAGIGAVVTAEDGSWAILVTVDVDATDGPGASVGPRSDASTPPDPDAAPGPSATTGAALPTPVHTEPPADAEAPATVPPSATAAPATVPPSATPAAAATDPPSATAPAKLDPADAEAVRTIAGHIEALGRTVEASGRGTVRIPAADIGALVALAPDLAVEVRTGAGSITVTTELGDILITPDIGPDGLVELRLSRFAWVTSLPIVQQLVRSLNAGVSERGARFRTISVTPEGIELQAVGHTPGS